MSKIIFEFDSEKDKEEIEFVMNAENNQTIIEKFLEYMEFIEIDNDIYPDFYDMKNKFLEICEENKFNLSF